MWRRARYWILLVGLAAMATCPAAWRDFRKKQRSEEAPELLRYLASLVRAEYAERGGRFPQQSVGPTPPINRCCEQGGACEVDKALWQDPAWRALRFTVDEPHLFVYQYQVVDGGRAVVLRAFGDVDCDGTPSTVELRLDPGAGDDLAERWTFDHRGE
jgi:hypothetical protein